MIPIYKSKLLVGKFNKIITMNMSNMVHSQHKVLVYHSSVLCVGMCIFKTNFKTKFKLCTASLSNPNASGVFFSFKFLWGNKSGEMSRKF